MDIASSAVTSQELKPDSLPGLVLTRRLGRGGMAVVFEAEQIKLCRRVAVKMIQDSKVNGSLLRERFAQEAFTSGQLSHPGIVQTFEYGEHENRPYLVMEYCSGGSLGDRLRQSADVTMPAREAADLVRQLAQALEFAHSQWPPIVHRDVKPDNVLFTAENQPKLADFGLAKIIGTDDGLTATGDVVGTVTYMAPEQAAGRDVDPRADLYSLGAVLYRLLTGRAPIVGQTMVETLGLLQSQEPVAPRELQPHIPIDLETICLKCLEKEPDRRFATAGFLSDELSRFLAGEPIFSRPIGSLARGLRWMRRHPRDAAFGSVAIFGLLVALAATSVGYWQTTRALNDANTNALHALSVIDDLYVTVSEETLLNQPGMHGLRNDLLKKAQAAYAVFLERPQQFQLARDRLVETQYRLGSVLLDLKSREEAFAALQSAEQLLSDTTAGSVTTEFHQRLQGNIQNALGRYWAEVENLTLARLCFEQAIQCRRELAIRASDSVETQRQLANSLMNLGLASQDLEQEETAINCFEEAQEIRLRQLQASPDHQALKRDLIIGYYNLGRFLKSLDQPDHAVTALATAISQWNDIAEERRRKIDAAFVVAACERELGDILYLWPETANTSDTAQSWYQRAADRLALLVQANPDVVVYQSSWAGVQLQMAKAERESNRFDEALVCLAKAEEVYRSRISIEPRLIADYQLVLEEAVLSLEDVDARRQRVARSLLERALQGLANQRNQGSDSNRVEGIIAFLNQHLKAGPVSPSTTDVKSGD